jgi:hypothetical protein
MGIATDVRIPKGATIVIYYSGHGCLAAPPVGWPSREKIQSLVPHDMYYEGDEIKAGFTDIKFGQLLESIANEKGDNIVRSFLPFEFDLSTYAQTVILDCCHSASGTRVARDNMIVATRSFNLPLNAKFDRNAMIHNSFRSSNVPKIERNKGLASHVLLAACTDKEEAREDNACIVMRGRFTLALTELLRSGDLQSLTYTDIIQRLSPLPSYVLSPSNAQF